MSIFSDIASIKANTDSIKANSDAILALLTSMAKDLHTIAVSLEPDPIVGIDVIPTNISKLPK